MRNLFYLTLLMITVGCGTSEQDSTATDTSKPVDPVTEMTDANTSAGAKSESDATPVPSDVVLTSYTAGDSATLEVPEMACQINCYPKVKKTLEGITGVKSVELLPQADEVVVDDHRVKVEFDGTVDSTTAIAALTEAGYPGSQFKNP